MRNAQTFLRMETPPLRVGDVPFVDGNAAARTFGRAHRRRPYHSKHTSPFRKGENKSFNACIAYANGKMQKMALA